MHYETLNEGLALRQRADLLYWPIFRLTNLAFLRAKAIPTNLHCRVLAGCFVLGERGVILDRKIKGKSRKIPKISPEAYIFQRPFLRGLLLDGLMFGGAYLLREIFVYKSIRVAS